MSAIPPLFMDIANQARYVQWAFSFLPPLTCIRTHFCGLEHHIFSVVSVSFCCGLVHAGSRQRTPPSVADSNCNTDQSQAQHNPRPPQHNQQQRAHCLQHPDLKPPSKPPNTSQTSPAMRLHSALKGQVTLSQALLVAVATQTQQSVSQARQV